jgi:hypothetical protein
MERVFILDVSGSMNDCLSDTIGGFDAFVEDQKNLGGTLSLFLFNDALKEEYIDTPIEQVQPLTFVPQGGTALYDAIGKVLTTQKLSNTSTVIILTDGHENSSRQYNRQVIRDLIKMKESDGVRFLFLGAKEDAFDGAEDIGISRNNRLNYYGDSQSPAAFHDLTQCLRARSKGVERPLSRSDMPPTTPTQDTDIEVVPETQVV